MKTRKYSFTMTIPQVKEPTAGGAFLCRTPQDVRNILAETADFAQEAFTLLTLNKKNWVIDKHLITLGVLDASLIHQREVFRQALEDSASAIIISHNHCSGDPAPSAEDLAVTRQMVAAGRIIGIRVLDHVVIGRGERPFFSLRESGMIDFEH